MARTPSPIDWAKFDKYLKLGASQIKISKALGITEDTLRKRVKEKYGIDYSVYSAEFRCKGQLEIEEAQFDNALAGNTQLLLWLGKVLCQQTDAPPEEKLSPNEETIIIKHENMLLKAELSKLKEQNAYQRQTESEF